MKSDLPLFSWLINTKPTALVWGWMPQWYGWGELTPASRETHTQAQIRQNALTSYFRERLLEDVINSNPTLVIDAVGGSSFAYKDRQTQGIDSFPALKTLVAGQFTTISKPEYTNCPALYLNTSKESAFRKLVQIESIEVFGPNGKKSHDDAWQHINDYSVSEDMCIDYAFFPAFSSIKLDFEPAQIQKMLILNSHGGNQYNHATNEVKVTAYLGDEPQYSSRVKLASHPYWSKVSFPKNMRADHLSIEILSYYGNGAGLNEIKLYSP